MSNLLREQSLKALNRHLVELNVTLDELEEYSALGWFPSMKHKMIWSLAYDLGLVST